MTFSVALHGGLDPALDLALVEGHADPATFETFNVWLVDGTSGIGLNMHLYYVRGGEARERASLFLPDGRTLISHSLGQYDRAEAPGGASLRYLCRKPFELWDYRWEAETVALTEAAEMAGFVGDDGPKASVAVAINAQCVSEPWIIPLSSGPETRAGPAQIATDAFLGKYEQLLQGQGTVRVGEEQWSFAGVGLRGHVRGPRDTTGMGSHAWVCGQFPSGRGFGVKQLFTMTGEAYFSEAYITDHGRVIRATIRQCPVLSRAPEGHDCSVLLDVEGQQVRITGEMFHRTWIPLGDWGNGAARSAQGGSAHLGGAFASGHGLVSEAQKIMVQSCARFDWDGEAGCGMAEISG